MVEPSVFPHVTCSDSSTTALRPPSSIGQLADQLKLSSLNEPNPSDSTPQLISVDQATLYLRRLSSRRIHFSPEKDDPAIFLCNRKNETVPEFSTSPFNFGHLTLESDGHAHEPQTSPFVFSSDELRDPSRFYSLSAPNSRCLTTSSSLPAFTFPSSSLHGYSTTVTPTSHCKVPALNRSPRPCVVCLVKCRCFQNTECHIPCKRVCRSLSARVSMRKLSHYSSQQTLKDAAALEVYRNALPRPVPLRITPNDRTRASHPIVSLRPKRENFHASRLSWHYPHRSPVPPHASTCGPLTFDFFKSVDLESAGITQSVSVTPGASKSLALQIPGPPSGSDSGNSHSSGLDLPNRGFSAFTPTRTRCGSALGDSVLSPITGSSVTCGPLPVPTPSSGFDDTLFSFPESSSLPDHIRPGENLRDQFATLIERHIDAKESATAGIKRRRGPTGEDVKSSISVCSRCHTYLQHPTTSTLRTHSPGSVFDRQETVVPSNPSGSDVISTGGHVRGDWNLESSSSDQFIFGFSASVTGDNPLSDASFTKSHSPGDQSFGSRCSLCDPRHPLGRDSALTEIVSLDNPAFLMQNELSFTSTSPNLFEHRCRRTCATLGGLCESLEENDYENPETVSEGSVLEPTCRHSSLLAPVLSPSIFDVTFEPIRDPNDEELRPVVARNSFFASSPSEFAPQQVGLSDHHTTVPATHPIASNDDDVLIPLSSSDSEEEDQLLSPQLLNRQKCLDGCVRQLPCESSSPHHHAIDLSLIEEN